ncbi:hypothetical protein LCGC14_2178010 [marine sediment metagenome]|uniref:Uncharacterized protein n=1 Tax=marine sediment metagenome TaxID=412755 RepID=A0A0F9DN53_9ZZZZ
MNRTRNHQGVTFNGIPLDKWLKGNILPGMSDPVDQEVKDEISTLVRMPIRKRKPGVGQRSRTDTKPGEVRHLSQTEIEKEYGMSSRMVARRNDEIITYILNHADNAHPVGVRDIALALKINRRDAVSSQCGMIWKRLGTDHVNSASILKRTGRKVTGYFYSLDELLTTTPEQAIKIYKDTAVKQGYNPAKIGAKKSQAPKTPAPKQPPPKAQAPELPEIPIEGEQLQGFTLVNVRWFDGYLEAFECQEVRQSGSILWMRLVNGQNRTVPLGSVRWFSTDPESHAVVLDENR